MFHLSLGQRLWDRKTENKTGFPLCGVETHTRLWLLSFCSAAAKKTCFSRIARHRCRASSPNRTRVTTKLESVRSTKLRVSLPSLRTIGGLCLEVSLGMWGTDPVLYQLFAIQNRRSSPIRKKKNSERVQAPTSQARLPRHRPPTAVKLVSEDSQLSGAYALQVWW